METNMVFYLVDTQRIKSTWNAYFKVNVVPVYVVFLQVLFISSGLEKLPLCKCITKWVASFLNMSHVIVLEFLALTCNIPTVIVSEKKKWPLT